MLYLAAHSRSCQIGIRLSEHGGQEELPAVRRMEERMEREV
jgi:hypothetical protein